MSIVASDIYEFLEGYGITNTQLSPTWIQNRLNNFVIPYIERLTGMSFDGSENVTEYLSGSGEGILMLSKKNATALVSLEYVSGNDVLSEIGLGGVVLIEGGIVKAVSNVNEEGTSTIFRRGNRNVKVVYTVGEDDYPVDVKEAIIYLASEQALGFIGARTGGGSINVQGFGRNFGQRGKWQDIRNDLKRQAMVLLKPYMTGVVGSI
jgi:hypothetical protein